MVAFETFGSIYVTFQVFQVFHKSQESVIKGPKMVEMVQFFGGKVVQFFKSIKKVIKSRRRSSLSFAISGVSDQTVK